MFQLTSFLILFAVLMGLTIGCAYQHKMDMGHIRPDTKPNKGQQDMIARCYGMFIHFGINTYTGDNWTDGTISPSVYNPTTLDTDQWAKTAKDAGMSYVILITKHHDGFCLWNSEHSTYDVGSSPVKTDVIKSMSESCKKYGIKLGLYYSLWDRNWNNGFMRNKVEEVPSEVSDAYVTYMCNHLTELLSNYGDVCELWFDGGWAMPREAWQIQRVYDHVKSLQPNCLLSANWTIGKKGELDFNSIHPCDYEEGQPIRYFPSDFRLGDPDLPIFPDVKLFSGPEGEIYYLPFETTVCLNKMWFWHPDDTTLRSVDELEKLYEHSTAQDNVLILNSPPDREGRMEERNIARLKEIAKRLGAKEGERIPLNLAMHATAEASSCWKNMDEYNAQSAIDGNPATRWAAEENKASLTITLPEPKLVEFLRIREYEESDNFRITKFAIDAYCDDSWQEVLTGDTIGKSKLLHIRPTKANRLRLRILEATLPPSIWHISVHGE